MPVQNYYHLFSSPSRRLFALTTEECFDVQDMIPLAIICSPWANRVCSYPGLEPKGFLTEGYSKNQLVGSYIQHRP